MSVFREPTLIIRSVITTAMLLPVSSIHADLAGRWDVGAGSSTAMIQFDFLSGNSYVVDLFFEGSMSGQEALELIAADSTDAGFAFDYDVISYSFGDFLVEIELDSDADYGDGSTPPYVDYWHYWTSDANGGWEESMIGFGDRILHRRCRRCVGLRNRRRTGDDSRAGDACDSSSRARRTTPATRRLIAMPRPTASACLTS